MAGQSAHLSIKEAKAMQERIQASGSQACCKSTGGGGKGMESMRKTKAGK